jgi:uncharacterized protein (TIGR02001 family)
MSPGHGCAVRGTAHLLMVEGLSDSASPSTMLRMAPLPMRCAHREDEGSLDRSRQPQQRALQRFRQDRSGRPARAPSLLQREQGLDPRGRPGHGFPGETVEAALIDRERGLVGGADPRRGLEPVLVRRCFAAACQLADESQHVVQALDLGAGIGEARGLEASDLVSHGARFYRAAAKEELKPAGARLRRGRRWGTGGGMRAVSRAAVLLSLALAAPARAQDEPPGAAGGGGLALSGEALLLSDFRFRGVSRSGEDPAVQGQLTLSLPSGLYAGARGTGALDDVAPLGNLQLDLYAGYGLELGSGTSLDAGLIYYWFPDGDGATDHFEPYASVSHLLGPVEATLGAKYAPEQEAIGGEDRLYLFGEVEAGIPLTRVTLTASAGWQDAGALGRYWNWSLGGRYAFGPFEAGLRYVDTDLPSAPGQDAGVVLSLGFRF